MNHATLRWVFKKLTNYDSPYSKTVLQYNLDGEFIKEYGSISDAYRKTKISIGTISLNCNGKKQQGAGYIWKFKTI